MSLNNLLLKLCTRVYAYLYKRHPQIAAASNMASKKISLWRDFEETQCVLNFTIL